MKVEIKNRYTGKVIITLEGYADLRCADLWDANLRYADLRGADLRYAALRDADLRDANLRGADLRYADLRYAALRYADLRDADLRDADLRGADLPKTDIVINNRYFIHIRPDSIRIGCEKHEPSWFKKLTIKKAEEVHGEGDWWREWKPVVLAIWETIKDRK